MTLKTVRFLIPGVWRARKCQGATNYLGADAAPDGQIFPAHFKQFIDLERFLPFSKFKPRVKKGHLGETLMSGSEEDEEEPCLAAMSMFNKL